jgi:GntR family transcriptional regulator, transcriptional repressor for pyruvate dehydrogenase complex
LCGSGIPRPDYIAKTKGRTIAERRATAGDVGSGDMDAAALAMREHLVAAGQRLRALPPSEEKQG